MSDAPHTGTAPARKAWSTPEVVEYGPLAELTLDQAHGKKLGIHDSVPFADQQNCPPGEFPCSA